MTLWRRLGRALGIPQIPGHAAGGAITPTRGATYRPTLFSCGSCGRPLDFELLKVPPQASYVHADGRRFACDAGGTDAHTAALVLTRLVAPAAQDLVPVPDTEAVRDDRVGIAKTCPSGGPAARVVPAGRDLTADDVRSAIRSAVGVADMFVQDVADYLNRIARPARDVPAPTSADPPE